MVKAKLTQQEKDQIIVDVDVNPNRKSGEKFTYWSKEGDDYLFREEASCFLKCRRCFFVNPRSKLQCKKNVCIGRPYCWQHLLQEMRLRVRRSTLVVDGKSVGNGLFAEASASELPTLATNNQGVAIVFRKGDSIAPYHGIQRTKQQTQLLYGNTTAPYAIHLNKDTDIDAACDRGIASLANHKPMSQCNAELKSGGGKVSLKAKKNIRQGEEIFANYGNAYNFGDNDHETKRRKI